MVSVARRALGTRRIGHAGTLDPFATGLLVLLVGNATRLLPHLDGEPKVYEATIVFGAETDTDDVTGRRGRDTPRCLTSAACRRRDRGLTGTIEQVPPAYSAKQVGGTARLRRRATRDAARAAAGARDGARLARSRADAPTASTRRITCGGGTYIRALARDLGRRCGSAAHLGDRCAGRAAERSTSRTPRRSTS